jgi:hypothetical protein
MIAIHFLLPLRFLDLRRLPAADIFAIFFFPYFFLPM